MSSYQFLLCKDEKQVNDLLKDHRNYDLVFGQMNKIIENRPTQSITSINRGCRIPREQ